eukprot:TRINITY_DN22385_c0_g1_i2.p1 TRINITY_DN22385_c0_g1~~TRINITY_DN22385_c0_g1_i2.p1  ORF type:complete len:466 (+),score=121.89 TRINITY_DN22385_c0_g1_i2:8-1405(+)
MLLLHPDLPGVGVAATGGGYVVAEKSSNNYSADGSKGSGERPTERETTNPDGGGDAGGQNHKQLMEMRTRTEKTKKLFSWINICILIALVFMVLWAGRSNYNDTTANRAMAISLSVIAKQKQLYTINVFQRILVSNASDDFFQDFRQLKTTLEENYQTLNNYVKSYPTYARYPSGIVQNFQDLMTSGEAAVSSSYGLLQLPEIILNNNATSPWQVASSSFDSIVNQFQADLDLWSTALYTANSLLIWSQVLLCMLALPVIMMLAEIGRVQEDKLQVLGELAAAEKVFDLNSILHDPIGAKLIQSFARSLFAEESLEFYHQVSDILKSAPEVQKKLRMDRNPEVASNLITRITILIDRAVKSGSLKEINIDSHLRAKVIESLLRYISETTTDAKISALDDILKFLLSARNEVFVLIKTNIYNPFVRSPEFEQFLSRRKRIYNKEMAELDSLLMSRSSPTEEKGAEI